jgi:hypothetical protein
MPFIFGSGHSESWRQNNRISMRNCTGARKTYWQRIRYRASSACLCFLFLGMILAGCEAPLDLAGVNSQLSQPTQRADLFQAAARHQDTVIAVGGMGTIVQSLDGGGSWQRTTVPGKPFLVDVAVCPDGSFHAIDKTDGIWSIQPDGIWARQALPEMTEPQAMTCDASGVIWVTGGFSTILHSTDAGANWDSWSLDEDLYLTTIQFVDQQHGIVTGEFGTVLLTADSGLTWSRADDLPDSFYPQSAYFTSETTTGSTHPCTASPVSAIRWSQSVTTRRFCTIEWVMHRGPPSTALPSPEPICVALPALTTVSS